MSEWTLALRLAFFPLAHARSYKTQTLANLSPAVAPQLCRKGIGRKANEVLFARPKIGDDGDVNSVPLHVPFAKGVAARRDARVRHAECLATRTLLSVARQRRGLDAARCQLVFEHLDAALSVRTALHRTLAEYHFSELQFGVMVALFALDPEPVMPADLADYTAVSRAAITDAVVRLESLQLVSRTRDHLDRRVYHLQLTTKGRTTVDDALNRYLSAVGHVARYIEPHAQSDLLDAYQRLHHGAAELAQTRPTRS